MSRSQNTGERVPLRSVKRNQFRALAAFTLIELVISSSLMTIIVASAYLCLSSGVSSRKLIETRAQAAQSARVALNIMSTDLRGACPISKDIAFLGAQRMLGEIEAGNVDFATHNYTPHRSQEGDFCEISYFLGKDKDSGEIILWRRRHPAIALEPLSGGTREEIARGVRGLKFEYYDGFDWYDEWGDAEGKGKADTSLKQKPNLVGLPEAVRITLWVSLEPAARKSPAQSEDAEEPSLAFQTVCRLNLADLSLRNTSGSSTKANPATQPAPANQNAPGAIQ